MAGQERLEYGPQKALESKEHKECVFCSIRRGEVKSFKIAESDDALAFMSLEGHPLVAPKAHVNENLEENIEGVTAAFKLASELVPFVKKAYLATGVNIVANIGLSAGQEVAHFHVHIVPRRDGDKGLRLKLVNIPKRKEFESLASKVAQAYQSANKSS